jgi:hypothetical protein
VVFERHRTSAPCFGARSGGIGRFDVGRRKQRQRVPLDGIAASSLP